LGGSVLGQVVRSGTGYEDRLEGQAPAAEVEQVRSRGLEGRGVRVCLREREREKERERERADRDAQFLYRFWWGSERDLGQVLVFTHLTDYEA